MASSSAPSLRFSHLLFYLWPLIHQHFLMPLNRWVVVDDNDPAISYSEGWDVIPPGNSENIGNTGPPYLGTLHSLHATNGSASLRFNGTAIEVWGTTGYGVPPGWRCFIDDVQFGTFADSPANQAPFAANNQKLCGQANLSNGVHDLRIEATNSQYPAAFSLDQIRYLPSPNLRLDNKVILIESTDPAVQFNANAQWTSFGEKAYTTNTAGPVAQITFVGISISWIGLTQDVSPNVFTEGSWSIDGGQPTQFVVPAPPPSLKNSTIWNQQYFMTPDYPVGVHNLSVTYLGDNTTVPFFLNHLYVRNGTLPDDDMGSLGGGGYGKERVRGIPVVTIVAGVLGGIALLSCLMCALFLRRWRRRRHSRGSVLGRSTPTQFKPHQSGYHDTSVETPGTMTQLDYTPTKFSQDAPPRYTKC